MEDPIKLRWQHSSNHQCLLNWTNAKKFHQKFPVLSFSLILSFLNSKVTRPKQWLGKWEQYCNAQGTVWFKQQTRKIGISSWKILYNSKYAKTFVDSPQNLQHGQCPFFAQALHVSEEKGLGRCTSQVHCICLQGLWVWVTWIKNQSWDLLWISIVRLQSKLLFSLKATNNYVCPILGFHFTPGKKMRVFLYFSMHRRWRYSSLEEPV